MDADRFDALARALTDPTSRRGILGGLLGGAAVGLWPAVGMAKSKNKKQARKKKKKRCQRECDGCCGGNGGYQCALGTQVDACGKGGEACRDCSASDRLCEDQRCCRLAGSGCGFDNDCCGNAQCRNEVCCVAGGERCGGGCPQNGACANCCNGTCTNGECCGAIGAACRQDEDCCADDVLCLSGVCKKDSACPQGCTEAGGDGWRCCRETSDGRHNECLYENKVNCRLKTGNLGVVGCPLTTIACCYNSEGLYSCWLGPGECPAQETSEPEVTCLTW